MAETGQLYFRGIPRCGAGARATAPGYRRVRGCRPGGAVGVAGVGLTRFELTKEQLQRTLHRFPDYPGYVATLAAPHAEDSRPEKWRSSVGVLGEDLAATKAMFRTSGISAAAAGTGFTMTTSERPETTRM